MRFIFSSLKLRSVMLYEYLKSKNIFLRYGIPVHLQGPFYQTLGFNLGDYPIVEDYYQDCITLPLFPSLTEEEINYIISVVKLFFNE